MSITSAPVLKTLLARLSGSRLMLRTAFWTSSASRQSLLRITTELPAHTIHRTLAGQTTYLHHLTISTLTSLRSLEHYDSKMNQKFWWAGGMVRTTLSCMLWRMQTSLASWSSWTPAQTVSNGSTHSEPTTGQKSKCSNIGKQIFKVASI